MLSSSSATFGELPDRRVGIGGGKGDIEMAVTLAEWAEYTRRTRRRGNESTCWKRKY